MEIAYKITNQEMKDILSKELGVPVLEVTTDTDGNFIARTLLEKTTVGNIYGTDKIKKDFTERFGQEKTEKILSFFKEFFNGLKETTHPEHPDSIFLYKEAGSEKIVWMVQDTKNGYLWCRWDRFWSFFQNEISLNYTETQYVLKTVVAEHTKRDVGTPRTGTP